MYSPVITRNYYAPLTSRVDTLELLNCIQVRPTTHHKLLQSSIRTGPRLQDILAPPPRIRTARKRVRFMLPSNHTDKDSKVWRSKTTYPKSLRTRVLNGSVPSAVSDTGASASAFKPSDPTIATGIQSNTSFGGAFGDLAVATTVNKLHHNLREPARSVHIVPQLKDSLLSTAKMCGRRLHRHL